MYLSLYFALFWLASVRAAVQNAIPKWDVLPATEYTYRYTGFAQLYEHLNLSVHMEVSFWVDLKPICIAIITGYFFYIPDVHVLWQGEGGESVRQHVQISICCVFVQL